MIILRNNTKNPISFDAQSANPSKGIINAGQSVQITANEHIVPRIIFGNIYGEGPNGETYQLVKALDVQENATVTVSVDIT